MQAETKKLGVLLIEAGLITPGQLHETLRQQRLSGGRLGSTLVSMGVINEDCLMDFLARQTGVPRLDVKNLLDIPVPVLQRIPRRLAEQLCILPVAFKEPKSLVLAMADPMDLNAVDSARFSSGMTIEPMVAGHTALRQAISDHYSRLASGTQPVPIVDLTPPPATPGEGLPVPLELAFAAYDPEEKPAPGPAGSRGHGMDPFFPGPPPHDASPFSLFSDPMPQAPAKPAPEPAPGQSNIIHQRSPMAEHVRPLSTYGTRALVLGLIRTLQRRGVLGDDELQRLLQNLTENGDLDPDK